MALLGPLEKARIARAMWAYTSKDQKELAEEVGINYHRLRAITARENPSEATLDELLKLAHAAGIPERFALEGFSSSSTVGERVADLEQALSSSNERLAEEIDAIYEILETRFADLARKGLAQALPPAPGADRRQGERRQDS